jgi:hypothetical protein
VYGAGLTAGLVADYYRRDSDPGAARKPEHEGAEQRAPHPEGSHEAQTPPAAEGEGKAHHGHQGAQRQNAQGYRKKEHRKDGHHSGMFLAHVVHVVPSSDAPEAGHVGVFQFRYSL